MTESEASIKIKPASKGRMTPFVEGFVSPFTGLSFMFKRPGLWKYGVIPVLLNIVLTGLVLGFLFVAAGFSVEYVHAKFPDAWYWMVVKIICDIAMFLLALVVAFVSWLIMQAVLCGVFYEKLARQVELQLGIDPDELRDVPLWDIVSTVVRDVIALVIVNIGLVALHLVPFVGSAVAMAGSFYFNFLILGTEFLTYPLELRGTRRVEKRRFIKQHRYHTLGLGAAVMLLLLIPFVGAVFLTTAITGTVILHRRLVVSGE